MTDSSRRSFGPVLVVAASLFGLATARDAAAGEYEVWSCRAPDGTPRAAGLAGGAGTGGWRVALTSGNNSNGNTAEDNCAAGGALTAIAARQFPQSGTSGIAWRFEAPSSTVISRYALTVDGYVRPPTQPDEHFGDVAVRRDEQVDASPDGRWLGSFYPGIFGPQMVNYEGGGSTGVSLSAGCSGYAGRTWTCAADNANGVASVNLRNARFTLSDRDAPAVTSVSGDAQTDSLWAGSTGISVGASDVGGGVYRLGVEVDGQIRSWQYLAAAPCRPWAGTERTFLSPKPCPSTVGGVQQISTTDLPDGVHTVRVLVEDAAGNQTTAYGPVTKTLRRTADGTPGSPGAAGAGSPAGGSAADPGPLNGSPAVSDARIRARWTGREGITRSIRFNQRPKLDGQLTTPAGQPIKDAFVRVTIKRDARNSPSFARDSLRTDKNGRFGWTLPTGVSSRAILLSYHQRVNDTKAVATTRLNLRVTAAVRLTLSRKTARKGQAVRLRGKVLGRPMPKTGKLVELQARNPGRKWITFRTVRSRKSGSFSATYRFRNGGPARFQMRARVRKTGDYPYATGSSAVRSIRIR
ncbi:hypothetical protein [Patulibacter sp.]|uniref:hypothetical protein n=1 Tax=Patulibacter sp. TaxID=1912859 RepID=UPI00271EAF56|nr:hypothetical protein [Patulibacter sp.]MDO9408203.1 hypothetical protein [Patulibacter sp.]